MTTLPAQVELALLYVAVGALAAMVVAVVFRAVVHRLTATTRTELDDILTGRLRSPMALSCLAAGLWYGADALTLPQPYPWLIRGGLATGLVLVWTFALSATSGALLDWLAGNRERYRSLVTDRTLPVFDIVAKTAIWGGCLYFVFLAWNIDLTGWLASAGIVGVAVGFAAKDTLSNLIAGVFILADAPYKLGDYLVLDSGERGEVVEIGIRTTRLKTRDDVEIIVPNAVMANQQIVNQSGGGDPSFRVRVAVSVAYGSDVHEVRGILQRIAETDDHIREQPVPRVRFRALGASGLDFELLGWVDDPSLRGRATDSLLTRIYDTLNEQGIEIPYPKRDVYLHTVPTEAD
jgi:small-conductance mechanosensitive channel